MTEFKFKVKDRVSIMVYDGDTTLTPGIVTKVDSDEGVSVLVHTSDGGFIEVYRSHGNYVELPGPVLADTWDNDGQYARLEDKARDFIARVPEGGDVVRRPGAPVGVFAVIGGCVGKPAASDNGTLQATFTASTYRSRRNGSVCPTGKQIFIRADDLTFGGEWAEVSVWDWGRTPNYEWYQVTVPVWEWTENNATTGTDSE